MARTSTFPAYDLALGGELANLLAEWRGEGTSVLDITIRLRDRGVVVSTATVYRWLREHVEVRAS